MLSVGVACVDIIRTVYDVTKFIDEVCLALMLS